MLNLTQIDNFRHEFFNDKRNLNYLKSIYGTQLCEQNMFLSIINVDDKLQYHTKIYHSVETYDELIDIYKTICDDTPEQKLRQIITIRDELKRRIENVDIDVHTIMNLSSEFDREELFHLATLIYRFKKNLSNQIIKRTDTFYCFSEIYDAFIFDDDVDKNFNCTNIKQILQDNPAHVRVIFKKSNDNIYMYDSDICIDFSKIKYFFDYIIDKDIDMYHYLEKFVPIQEITDDCYCLFHCLRILELIYKYDMHDYNKIYSRISRKKFTMKKWISKFHKKIQNYTEV